MADTSRCPPLIRDSVIEAHRRIEPYIHRTPVDRCTTLDAIASSPSQLESSTAGSLPSDDVPLHVRLFFKCENQQKIGAFKARGAFHALSRLIEERGLEEIRRGGVTTHSSGMYNTSVILDKSVDSWQVITLRLWHWPPNRMGCRHT